MNKLKLLALAITFIVVSGMILSTAYAFYHYNENIKDISNSSTQILNSFGG